MIKKKSELLVQDKQAVKNGKHIPDRQIDFSDIPESTDEELKNAKRVGRPKSGKPVRQLIAIRLDPALLRKLKKLAQKKDQPYQTLIHDLLEKATQDVA